MNSKHWVLLALAGVSFVSGAVNQYFYPGDPMPPTAFAAMVLGLLLIFAWYRIDSAQRGARRSPLLDVGVILMAVVALPIHFFRSRGAKGGFVATALFLLSLVGSSLLGIAGQYAAYYGLQA